MNLNMYRCVKNFPKIRSFRKYLKTLNKYKVVIVLIFSGLFILKIYQSERNSQDAK